MREPRGRAGALFAGWGAAAAIGLVPFLNVVVWVLGSMFGLGAAVVAIWRPASAAPSRGRHRAGTRRRRDHHDPAGRPGRRPSRPSPSRSPEPAEAYPATSDD